MVDEADKKLLIAMQDPEKREVIIQFLKDEGALPSDLREETE